MKSYSKSKNYIYYQNKLNTKGHIRPYFTNFIIRTRPTVLESRSTSIAWQVVWSDSVTAAGSTRQLDSWSSVFKKYKKTNRKNKRDTVCLRLTKSSNLHMSPAAHDMH